MTIFSKFLNVLFVILFSAGYLSIIVVASVINHGGNPQVGEPIAIVTIAMGAVLGFGMLFIHQAQKRELRRKEVAAQTPLRTTAFQESETYQHDMETVWDLIRPAETAVLLSKAQRAFTVPGTPVGVGEQQCFIDHDGSATIFEVVGEERPRWSSTRLITPSEADIRQTYQIEATATGCALTIGVALETAINTGWSAAYESVWRAEIRQYLTRVGQVLDARYGLS